jgi:hypothetical protein
MESKVKVPINIPSYASPEVAALLVNAFYSALLLEKQSGREITKELEAQTLNEVMQRWINLQGILSQSLLKLFPQNVSNPEVSCKKVPAK